MLKRINHARFANGVAAAPARYRPFFSMKKKASAKKESPGGGRRVSLRSKPPSPGPPSPSPRGGFLFSVINHRERRERDFSSLFFDRRNIQSSTDGQQDETVPENRADPFFIF